MQSLRELYRIGRGPSSSHTMGPEKAAKRFLALCPAAAHYKVTLFGSLAYTGRGHLTDEAIRLVFAPVLPEIVFDLTEKNLKHPNTMTFEATDGEGKLLLKKTYLSIGGGAVVEEGERVPEGKEVYPFADFNEIAAYCKRENLTLDGVVFRFEADMREYLSDIWKKMQETVERGLHKTGELPGDLHVRRKAATLFSSATGGSLRADSMREVCAYAFSAAEENACGGTIVTAPTCGASGVLPAVLVYLKKKLSLADERIVEALAVAGMIGNVVKTNASVSGAEAGCQAEIGTATAMAAAAVCRIAGYSLEETEYAAEIALEHQLGLTCDPVHGFVQIPCIERNAVSAMRALDSAELAHVLAGTRKVSFDTIVSTMYETGKDLSSRYRETSEGGLAVKFKMC